MRLLYIHCWLYSGTIPEQPSSQDSTGRGYVPLLPLSSFCYYESQAYEILSLIFYDTSGEELKNLNNFLPGGSGGGERKYGHGNKT